MTNIKIVTDSAADVPPSLAHELGIEVVPMHIQIGEQTYRAGVDISHDHVYQAMQDGRQRVTLLPPPLSAFEQTYRRLALEYEHVFSIHLSSRIGQNYRTAQQARTRLPASATRVEIVDSKLASHALGTVVMNAARAIRDGIEPADASHHINRLIQHSHLVFFVDTIEHLEHGGRLSLATAVLGSMQRIKPLMLLDEGEIVPYERTRTRAKAIEGLYTFIEDFPHVLEVTALYTTTPEDVEKLLEKVDPIFPRDQISIAQFGQSFGSLLGPGAMGVSVFEGLD